MHTDPRRGVLSRRTFLGASATTLAAAGIGVLAPSAPANAKLSYDRIKATTWAKGRVYDDPDPIKFDNNCTWYVSKVGVVDFRRILNGRMRASTPPNGQKKTRIKVQPGPRLTLTA